MTIEDLRSILGNPAMNDAELEVLRDTLKRMARASIDHYVELPENVRMLLVEDQCRKKTEKTDALPV